MSATARSDAPSPLKSPTATEKQFAPASNVLGAVKLGAGNSPARAGAVRNRELSSTADITTVRDDIVDFAKAMKQEPRFPIIIIAPLDSLHNCCAFWTLLQLSRKDGIKTLG